VQQQPHSVVTKQLAQSLIPPQLTQQFWTAEEAKATRLKSAPVSLSLAGNSLAIAFTSTLNDAPVVFGEPIETFRLSATFVSCTNPVIGVTFTSTLRSFALITATVKPKPVPVFSSTIVIISPSAAATIPHVPLGAVIFRVTKFTGSVVFP
jgi:hypothetical protein